MYLHRDDELVGVDRVEIIKCCTFMCNVSSSSSSPVRCTILLWKIGARSWAILVVIKTKSSSRGVERLTGYPFN